MLVGTTAQCNIEVERVSNRFVSVPLSQSNHDIQFRLWNHRTSAETFTLVADALPNFQRQILPGTQVTVPAGGFEMITVRLTGITGPCIEHSPWTYYGLSLKADIPCGTAEADYILKVQVNEWI